MNSIGSFLPKRFLVLAGAVAFFAPAAPAAQIKIEEVTRLSAVVSSPIDLTTEGSIDWAYWNPTSGTALTAPVPPNNEKLVGSIISSLSNVGGTSLRGSTTASTVGRYSWTDGTSPTTGTNESLAGLIFNSDLGSNAPGKGFSLTLAGDPTTTRYANLYFGAFGATGVLTLTLNGAPTIVDMSQVFANNGPKHLSVYTISYRPDSASDLLTVQYTAAAITDTTNGHVGGQAVTVSLVPEPGTITLGAVGAVLLLGRQRRK